MRRATASALLAAELAQLLVGGQRVNPLVSGQPGLQPRAVCAHDMGGARCVQTTHDAPVMS
jgi:hypothetical protein